MSLCRSALRGLSEERRTHKKRAVTKELDNCRRCGQASHRNLSNALNDIDSTTWLAKRMHSDDCGAAVGKHALVVFTGTADFKCDLVSQKAPIYRGVATSVSDLQRCQRGLLTRACSIAAPLSSAPHSLMSLLCWKINGSTASPHGLTLV